MMEFRRRLAAGAVVLALAVGVTGIATLKIPISEKKTEEEETSRSLFRNDRETLYLWYTDEQLTEYLDSEAVAYNSLQDEVRVIPELQSSSEFVENINNASVQADHYPDLYLVSNDVLGKAYLAGIAKEIEIPGNGDLSIYFPQVAIDAATYKDQIVGYPLSYVTSSLIYNQTYLEEWAKDQIEAMKDQEIAEQAQAQADAGNVEEGSAVELDKEALDEGMAAVENVEEEEVVLTKEEQEAIAQLVEEALPSTIDELLQFADTYDAPEQVDGVLKWDVTDIFYNYFVVGDAINIGGETGDQLDQIDLYNEDAIRSLRLYQSLNQFFSIEADEISYDGVVQDFIDGKLVFMIATPDCISLIEQAQEENVFPYEYGVAKLPGITDTLTARSLSVSTNIAINAYSEKTEAANAFAYYLARQDGERFYQRTGKVSARKDVMYENPYVGEFMREFEQSVPVAKMIETNNYWMKLEVAFAKIWQGDDPNSTLRILSEEIMTQVTGEPYEEEEIKIQEEIEEEQAAIQAALEAEALEEEAED